PLPLPAIPRGAGTRRSPGPLRRFASRRYLRDARVGSAGLTVRACRHPDLGATSPWSLAAAAPHGVSRAALIASVPGDEVSVTEAVRHAPDRFVGFFMVNPLAEDAV